MKTIDVGAAIDEGRWTGYQKLLIFGTALTIILDGVDNQILPNAIPVHRPEWFPDMPPRRERAAPFGAWRGARAGMMIGGLLGGVIGDKFGRRTALLLSVITFAVLTFVVAFIDSVVMLSALRFLAGVGLGGAMPNAASLASEYVPRRQRPFAVTLTIVCIPLGGFVASTMTRLIAPTLRLAGALHYRRHRPAGPGGRVCSRCCPSRRATWSRRRDRWPELTRTMRRIGHTVPDDVEYVEAAAGGGPVKKAAIRDLFAPQYLRDTLGLFGSFFFCLMANYVVIQLLTSTLRDHGGFTPAAAPSGLQWVNIGGVAGAVLGALVIQRIGSRATMLGMSAAAIVFSIVLAGIGHRSATTPSRSWRCCSSRAACSTRCRRRCTRWRHTCIRRRSAAPASARRWRSAASATSSRSTSAATRSKRGRAWLLRIVGGVDGAGVRLAGRHPAARAAQFSRGRRSSATRSSATKRTKGGHEGHEGSYFVVLRGLVTRPRHLETDERQDASQRLDRRSNRAGSAGRPGAASGRSPCPAAATASDPARSRVRLISARRTAASRSILNSP